MSTEEKDTFEKEVSSIVKEVHNFADSIKEAILSFDFFEEEEKLYLVQKIDNLKK